MLIFFGIALKVLGGIFGAILIRQIQLQKDDYIPRLNSGEALGPLV